MALISALGLAFLLAQIIENTISDNFSQIHPGLYEPKQRIYPVPVTHLCKNVNPLWNSFIHSCLRPEGDYIRVFIDESYDYMYDNIIEDRMKIRNCILQVDDDDNFPFFHLDVFMFYIPHTLASDFIFVYVFRILDVPIIEIGGIESFNSTSQIPPEYISSIRLKLIYPILLAALSVYFVVTVFYRGLESEK